MGEPAQKTKGHKGVLWSEEGFIERLDDLRSSYHLLGPAGPHGKTVFRRVDSAADLNLAGERIMIPPARAFFFPPRQELVRFDLQRKKAKGEADAVSPALLAGVLPCDVHALLYLDLALADDPYYQEARRNILVLAFNCLEPSPYCFCSSMETGPFLKTDLGCEAVVTRLAHGYLVEPLTERGEELFAGGEEADSLHWQEKQNLEDTAYGSITKKVNRRGLQDLLRNNLDHAVWQQTAEERCLSCSNCVMVCPTCFCHDIRDRIDMGLDRGTRYRQWDSCQDRQFAEVHGGNFRPGREARLRQFVLHKLDYSSQYGRPGTVGCGRCIEWCPTAIDLTEMAAAIRGSSDG